MKRSTRPPLSPGDAADLLPPSLGAKAPVQATQPCYAAQNTATPADVEKSSIDSLLPPGAEAESETPPTIATQPCFALQNTATRPQNTATRPQLCFALQNTATRREKKAERRLWKNAIMFGFFVVVLMVVFYFLAR